VLLLPIPHSPTYVPDLRVKSSSTWDMICPSNLSSLTLFLGYPPKFMVGYVCQVPPFSLSFSLPNPPLFWFEPPHTHESTPSARPHNHSIIFESFSSSVALLYLTRLFVPPRLFRAWERVLTALGFVSFLVLLSIPLLPN